MTGRGRPMSKMKQEEVERIAAEYVASLGVAPCLLDGSEFDDKENPPIWRVFFSFSESPEDAIGLPHFLLIEVNDLTREPSHIPHL
jgi:hypothetical protein